MLRNDNIIGKLRAGAASVDKQRGKKNAIIELAADLSKALHDEYIQEYESLSHQQRAWIAALVDTDSSEYHVGKIFKPSPAAYKIHLGFITGELSPKFTLDELKRFLTINEVSFRNDWRDRLEFIAADTPAASDTGKAGAAVDTGASPKADGLNIAKTIGAAVWAEIRIVIRPGDGDKDTGGITFHCGKKCKAYSWNDMGLRNADELQGVLMMLARDGAINWGKRLDGMRHDFDAKRAREQAAGKMRGRVNKLNAKFLKHFPAVWGNPFFNDEGITKHHFQKIEIQAMPDIAGVKQSKKYKHV